MAEFILASHVFITSHPHSPQCHTYIAEALLLETWGPISPVSTRLKHKNSLSIYPQWNCSVAQSQLSPGLWDYDSNNSHSHEWENLFCHGKLFLLANFRSLDIHCSWDTHSFALINFLKDTHSFVAENYFNWQLVSQC